MNLSWPKGCSVNNKVQGETYLGTTSELHYPSVDDLVNRLNTLGPSAKLFKVDISRAFRHIRIDPGDIDLLGLRINIILIWPCPLGVAWDLFSFKKRSDAVRYIMSKHGHTALCNYIGDLLYCDLPSKIQGPYKYLHQVPKQSAWGYCLIQLFEPWYTCTKQELQSLLGHLLYILLERRRIILITINCLINLSKINQ